MHSVCMRCRLRDSIAGDAAKEYSGEERRDERDTPEMRLSSVTETGAFASARVQMV